MPKKKLSLNDVETISVRKLASKIKSVDRQIGKLKGDAAVTARKPQYALFLGAGTSKDSGIILARQMMKIFKDEIFNITGFDDLMKEISEATDFSIDDLLESFERRKENLVERITKFNDNYTKKSLGEYADELTEKKRQSD